MKECIFCQIVREKLPCHKVWEDEKHLAFLSIYPNTLGVTVVITKEHYSSYAFDLPDEILSSLVIASKKVAMILDSKLPDVGRTAMVLEGFGVDHVHVKLFPMHGTKSDKWTPIKSNVNKYFNKYEGYISSHDYKMANQEELFFLSKELRK